MVLSFASLIENGPLVILASCDNSSGGCDSGGCDNCQSGCEGGGCDGT